MNTVSVACRQCPWCEVLEMVNLREVEVGKIRSNGGLSEALTI